MLLRMVLPRALSGSNVHIHRIFLVKYIQSREFFLRLFPRKPKLSAWYERKHIIIPNCSHRIRVSFVLRVERGGGLVGQISRYLFLPHQVKLGVGTHL